MHRKRNMTAVVGLSGDQGEAEEEKNEEKV
jgi:hypothetical protein